MKKFFHVLALTAISSACVAPTLALAENKDAKAMSCKEFSAMDKAGMMAAVEAMHKASADGAKTMDAAAVKAATETTASGCVGKPDMMAMDAMTKK